MAPDPRFLWPSETHEEGLAALVYGITRRKGFLLITGEVGTGKTTLLRAALDRIPQETEVALILNTAGLQPVDLLKLIATEFRLSGPFEGKVDYVIALNRFLMQQLETGTNTVLIIDEAQNLDEQLLEEVRLLSNLETDSEKLLQIVLTGQPELRQKLASPNLRQLRQRVAIEHHIQPLDRDEVSDYLAHRIEVAGGRYEDVFVPEAVDPFYEFSGRMSATHQFARRPRAPRRHVEGDEAGHGRTRRAKGQRNGSLSSARSRWCRRRPAWVKSPTH